MLIGKDTDLRGVVQNELSFDEQILWIGTPNPARMMLKNGITFLMGLVWLGFIIFFFRGFGFGFAGFGGFSLFSLIFYGVGIAMLLSPLWGYYQGLNTIYAVTNERLLIINRNPFGQSIRSFAERDIERIERREQSGGQGDLIFAQEQRSRRRRGYGRSYYMVDVGFIGIQNVRNVEEIVLETFRQANA